MVDCSCMSGYEVISPWFPNVLIGPLHSVIIAKTDDKIFAIKPIMSCAIEGPDH